MTLSVKNLISKFKKEKTKNTSIELLGKASILEESELEVLAALNLGIVVNKLLNDRKKNRNFNN